MKLVCLEIHLLPFWIAAIMREIQMQTSLDSLDESEIHLREIVIQRARNDPGLIHPEGQHNQVEHQFHVLGYVLRKSIRGTCHVRRGEGRTPPLQASILRSVLETFFDIAN